MAEDPNQAELPTKLLDHSGPLGSADGWVFTWELKPTGIQSAKIHILVAVRLSAFSSLENHLWSSFTGSSSDPHEVKLKWTSQKLSENTGEVRCPP